MDPELHAVLEEVRRHVDASATETRRHFDVAAEGLRLEIRLVAEGFAGASERVDRLEANLREDILRSQRELSVMIRFSYAELDPRFPPGDRPLSAAPGRTPIAVA